MTIQDHLQEMQARIAAYETRYQRAPHSVQLLAVSKKQSIEKMREAYQAGQRLFGENYLQEALSKMDALADLSDIEWHFIGRLQRNKTRLIAEHFAWVHSVSSELIASRLNDQRPASLPPLNVCLEVNIDQEPSKAGVSIAELISLAEACLKLPRLHLRGLMTIPEATSNFDVQRDHFHQLTTAFQALQKAGIPLDTLSMGMSADVEAAIAEGSTIVRIGTAIFGARD